MKKRIILAVIALAAAMTVNAQTLVVYYSRTGSNYTSDGIVNLKVGNTQVVAEQMQKLTKADIFRLETVKTYPADYMECTQVAKTVTKGLSIQGSKVNSAGKQIENFVKEAK